MPFAAPRLSIELLAAGLTALLLAGSVQAQHEVRLSPGEAAALRERLSVSRFELQDLDLPAEPGQPLDVDVRFGGSPLRLRLQPHSLRAADFRLLVQGEDGELREHAPTPPATYRGAVEGLPGSRVSASLVDGQLQALVRLGSGLPVIGVQPASLGAPAAPARLHAVYAVSDRLPLDVLCGTDTSGPYLAKEPLPPGPGDAPGDKVCEIACDADVEFFVKNGSSVAATQNDIEAVLNNVEAIYQSDVGVVYSIPSIIVRTVETDPYSATYSDTLLVQLKDHWNSAQGAIHRDIAHLFTGKDLDGGTIGVAYIGVICHATYGYGLSESKFSGNMAYRTALTAHEVGHNWSAQHCTGAADCSIMCSSLGGCSGDLDDFSQGEKNQILSEKNASSCLSNDSVPLAPTLSSLGPGSVKAFGGATVTLSGSNLAGATKVSVGGIDVTAADGLLGSSSTQVQFKPPAPTALGPASVTVTTPGGTSAPLTLTYTETSPPALAAGTTAVSGQPFTWSWGAGPSKQSWLVVSSSSNTAPFHGQPVLSSYTIVWMGKLNAAGVKSFTFVVPPASVGFNFWSQAFVLGPFVATPVLHSVVGS